MNSNIVRAVWKRDLRSWFGNPTGYVFIILFVGLSCFSLMFAGAFFNNNLANLDTLNEWFPLLAVLFVSASTMNIWASERANGTQELLFTLPGTDCDLQLGKSLAAVSVYTISLAFTAVLPIALSFLGSPDWGQLTANYIGYWLLGVMLINVSMVGSQLTQNSTVALILSILLCVLVLYLGPVFSWLADSLTWDSNGPWGQFNLFAGGEVPFSGVLLFCGLSVAFFYLGLTLLSCRHSASAIPQASAIFSVVLILAFIGAIAMVLANWGALSFSGRGLMRLLRLGVLVIIGVAAFFGVRRADLHRAIRFNCALVCVAALTVIGVQSLPRIDLTVEGVHSLGDETKKLLAGLDAEKPVYITAFISEEVPEQFVQQKKLLLNLLDQFDSIGGAAVERQIIIPDAYSPEARRAESDFGIRSQQVTVPMPGGATANIQMYLGFAVQCGTNETVTPFVGPAIPLEYELMRSIRTVSNATRRKVGILKTDVEVFGGFDMQTFQQKPRWAIAQELDQQYEIVNVDPAQPYPADIGCLVVPQGSSLEQEPMTRLQDWIVAGNPVILFEDPMPLSPGSQGTAADDQKGGAQARMMGQGGPPKGNWSGLTAAMGVSAPVGEITRDLSYQTFPGGQANPEIIFVRADGMSMESSITSGLQSVVSMMGGHVRSIGKEGFTVTPLLRSRATSRASIVMKAKLFRQSMPWMGPQYNPSAQGVVANDDLAIAVHIIGQPADGQDKGINAIYVADLDMIGDQFFRLRSQMSDVNLRFDNVTFALNCIDSLVGDESLIALRKRRPILRKLTKVEEAQATFEKQWQDEKSAAETAAQGSLAAARGRLDAAVSKIRLNKGLDAQAKEVKIVEVQQNEKRKLDLETAQIEEKKNRRLEEAQHDRDAARSSIHNQYRLITLLLAALPGLLLGLITYFRRSSRAAAIVPQNRQVQGGK